MNKFFNIVLFICFFTIICLFNSRQVYGATIIEQTTVAPGEWAFFSLSAADAPAFGDTSDLLVILEYFLSDINNPEVTHQLEPYLGRDGNPTHDQDHQFQTFKRGASASASAISPASDESSAQEFVAGFFNNGTQDIIILEGRFIFGVLINLPDIISEGVQEYTISPGTTLVMSANPPSDDNENFDNMALSANINYPVGTFHNEAFKWDVNDIPTLANHSPWDVYDSFPNEDGVEAWLTGEFNPEHTFYFAIHCPLTNDDDIEIELFIYASPLLHFSRSGEELTVTMNPLRTQLLQYTTATVSDPSRYYSSLTVSVTHPEDEDADEDDDNENEFTPVVRMGENYPATRNSGITWESVRDIERGQEFHFTFAATNTPYILSLTDTDVANEYQVVVQVTERVIRQGRQRQKDDELSTGQIVGIVFGALIGAALLLVLVTLVAYLVVRLVRKYRGQHPAGLSGRGNFMRFEEKPASTEGLVQNEYEL